jgi:hypothetical protein
VGKWYSRVKKKRNIFKQDSKPWYTNKCYEYRKKNHRARKTYNLHKNEPNGLQMIQCRKQYKQITNKAYNNYQFRLENELRTRSKTNSKEFWKILNSFLKKIKKMIKIYLWKFYIIILKISAKIILMMETLT